MFARDVGLIVLGVTVTIGVLNHPKVFELFVRLKADGIFRAAEQAVDKKALNRVLRALED